MNNPTISQQLARMDRDRMRRYNENLAFYNGEQWPRRATRGEKHLTFNYAKALVDKTTSYLMSGMSLAVDPLLAPEGKDEAKEKARSAEKALYQVYHDNNLQALDLDTEVDCAVLGDAAYKVTWDVKEKRVKVTAPDVQGLFAWWLPDDVSTVYRVASRYQLSADEVEVLYKRKPAGSRAWVVEIWTDRAFELWIDPSPREGPVTKSANPYGFIPFIIFPNLREPKQFWGYSDIPQIRGVQREINRSFTELSSILELSGHPITILEAVEAAEEIEIRPGAVWTLPEGSRAYLLDLLKGGGVRLHIDYINLLYRALHDLSETPRAAYGGVEKDLSGTALNIELQSLIHKVLRKRTTRTSAYYRRTQLILSLAEKFMGEDFAGLSYKVTWGPILPADVYRLAQSEQLLVSSMIHSRRTAADAMGVEDPDAEFDRALEERATLRQQNIKLPFPGKPERALESTIENMEEEL